MLFLTSEPMVHWRIWVFYPSAPLTESWALAGVWWTRGLEEGLGWVVSSQLCSASGPEKSRCQSQIEPFIGFLSALPRPSDLCPFCRAV